MRMDEVPEMLRVPQEVAPGWWSTEVTRNYGSDSWLLVVQLGKGDLNMETLERNPVHARLSLEGSADDIAATVARLPSLDWLASLPLHFRLDLLAMGRDAKGTPEP